jgi:Protein of unknown function
MIPAAEFDQLLLSFCDEHWRKVARIAAKTYQALEDRGMEITGATAKAFDARMAALVGTGQLEAKGDIKRWGYSEVRLPGSHREAAT